MLRRFRFDVVYVEPETLPSALTDHNIRQVWIPTLDDATVHRMLIHEVAEVLLANKADINARNDVGNTPLHIAEISANKEMAALLISKGADVNARNTGGDTPLHIAAAVGHADMVESLLAKGANANAKNTAGETPLRWAEKTGRKDMAEVLRKRGAHE